MLKWTFTQNQCCRVLNDEQLFCLKFFELQHKNIRKIWIPKCIGQFQIHLSFKILTFKRSFKWKSDWNKSCRILNFEQLLYSKFFELRLKILRKIAVKVANSLSNLSFSLPCSVLRAHQRSAAVWPAMPALLPHLARRVKGLVWWC